MLKTALLADARFLEHDAGPSHPECPERLACLLEAVRAPGREGIVRVDPRPATREEVIAVHTQAHWQRVADTAGRERTVFDADTEAVARTFDTALLASGGFLEVLDAIVAGRADNGFALVRPPGHHAESDRVMGFCFFNHAAIGAEHLRRRHGLERILVLDWDVHHGNGTQEIFEDDPGVFYVSLHEHPCYPGTGMSWERGTGRGEGFTLNVPLPAGSGDREVLAAYDRTIAPAIAAFRPQFVLVSAGFDAHRLDPLSNFRMSSAGFVELTARLMRVAREHAGGRIAAVLEGGYHLGALEECVRAVLAELRGARTNEEVGA